MIFALVIIVTIYALFTIGLEIAWKYVPAFRRFLIDLAGE